MPANGGAGALMALYTYMAATLVKQQDDYGSWIEQNIDLSLISPRHHQELYFKTN